MFRLLAWSLLSLISVHAIRESAQGRVGLNFSMVLVGGGLDDNNAEVWDRIVELGGGKGIAKFGVISAASEVSSTLSVLGSSSHCHSAPTGPLL